MPQFYDLYNGDDLEIYEGDSTKDYKAVESFSVEEDAANDQWATDGLEELKKGLEKSDDDTISVEEEPDITVFDDEPEEMTVPGSQEAFVQYSEDDEVVEEEPEDPNVQPKDLSKFLDWLSHKLTQIPQHSGKTIPGCERAAAYIKDLDNSASKAMRGDYDGKIDELKLDELRKDMQKMVDRLENHIERLRKNANQQKVRIVSEGFCKECESTAPMWEDPITKESSCMSCGERLQKTAATPILNVYMTPFERAVVGTIINATVSGGKNIEEMYERLKNKYNFTPREELSFQQLIADYGYPVYKDRGLLNEPTDPASGDNAEWQTNYRS